MTKQQLENYLKKIHKKLEKVEIEFNDLLEKICDIDVFVEKRKRKKQ